MQGIPESGIATMRPFFQQDDARRKQERFAKVMRDENDGLA